MLSGRTRAATHLVAPAATRSIASTSQALSQDAAAQAGKARGKNPNRRVLLRVLRTAAEGSYQFGAPSFPSSSPRSDSHALHQQRFKPTPYRVKAEAERLSRNRSVGRGRLVELDEERAAAVLEPAAARSFTRPQRHSRALSSKDSRQSRPSPNINKRSFSSSAAARVSLAEESLVDADADLSMVEGGLWDDTETGGSQGGKGKGKARDPKPGDWLESSRNGSLMSGIYLCPAASTARRVLILVAAGVHIEISLDDVTYIMPGLVRPALAQKLAPIALRYADPEAGWDPSQPEVVEMLQAMRKLEIAVEEETQELVSQGAGDVYRLLHLPPSGKNNKAPPAPKSATVASALAALRIPHGSSPPERLLALHRILLGRPEHFVADPLALRATGRFDLRPKDEVERLEQVREWVRHRSPELLAWTDKCAKVRGWAREQEAINSQNASSAADSLPRRTLPAADPTFSWSPSDMTIFAFLRDTIAADRLLQAQPHMAIAPSLLKHVDSTAATLGHRGWGGELIVNKARIRAFLAEVGVVAPWENWAAHERVTGLHEWDEMGERVARALRRPAAQPKRADKMQPLSSSELYPADPHDAVRRDFGRAKVYTIDDPSASELDDGISLTAGPQTSRGTPTWWVHVHVADPTALLHPQHLLARLARLRDHTEYFPEKVWPMLPDSFTHGNQLSLGALEGQEQRVLSISFRVDEERGEILETKVEAGVVRDVRRLTYGAVDKAFGYEAPPKGHVVHSQPVDEGKLATTRPPRATEDATLETDAESLGELRTLHKLARTLLRRRVESSALFWQFPSASVSVSPTPLSPHFQTSAQPVFYASPPHVSLQLPSQAAIAGVASHADSPAQLLVSELMVAANRAAARFAVEHSLPAPFRTQNAPASAPEDIEAVLALRNPATGQAPVLEVLKRNLDFLPGATTPTAGPHWPMGIDGEYGYLKVTSPLRRYSDLFAHFQLKGALLPTSSASTFAPRAALPTVLAHIDGFNAASKARHRLDQAAQQFWALWVLRGKLALLSPSTSRESALPTSLTDGDQHTLELLSSGLTALALRKPTFSAIENVYIQPVLVPQLGVRGTLRVDKEPQAPRLGEEVPVKIDEILLSARSKVVVGLRR
ncbi:exoribonuclease II [Rhodotorula paludigena]|uniref:exoribonuclease II n=1 Tax=Rhodotorula paludigena TaxID=86838 RepID=UPI003173AE63